MTQSTYSDCGVALFERGCGTCDVCVETAKAERTDGDGVLSAEQTAAALTHMRDEPTA